MEGLNEISNKIISFSPPDISDLEICEVIEALKSGWITTGPRTKLLERRLAAFVETGSTDIDCSTDFSVARYSNRVVCLNSATAAEELSLRILGVGPGDEVIVPAYTYTATASAAVHCGAKVVFADIQLNGDKETHMPEMDYSSLKSLISPRTKAIIAVDLAGIVCDYDKIYEIANSTKHLFTTMKSNGTLLGDLSARIQHSLGRIAVVADCAHALGASRLINNERRNCGLIADFSSFSFHAVKNFTTGEGGAAMWKSIDGVENSEIYKMYQLLSLHGQNKDALSKMQTSSWEYDIIGPWYKCNMTDFTAAIGLKQLDRYKSLLQRRSEIVKKYDMVCDELGIDHLIHHTPEICSSFHLYMIRIPGISEEVRNSIISQLSLYGVPTNVHYKPLPMMTAYMNMGWNIDSFVNSYRYYENLISLPLHSRLTDDDVDYICDNFRRVIKDVCPSCKHIY